MKKYLACVFLNASIALTALGVHTSNLILIGIGGLFAGFCNAIIFEQD